MKRIESIFDNKLPFEASKYGKTIYSLKVELLRSVLEGGRDGRLLTYEKEQMEGPDGQIYIFFQLIMNDYFQNEPSVSLRLIMVANG